MLARRAAWVKNVSPIRVRGCKAIFHRRGARLTEQARMLVASRTVTPLNQTEVKMAKKPSLSRTGVHPPYLEWMDATQLVYAAGSPLSSAGTCASRVPISDITPSARISRSPVRIEMKKRQSRSRTSVAETAGPPSRSSRPSIDSGAPASGRVRTS